MTAAAHDGPADGPRPPAREISGTEGPAAERPARLTRYRLDPDAPPAGYFDLARIDSFTEEDIERFRREDEEGPEPPPARRAGAAGRRPRAGDDPARVGPERGRDGRVGTGSGGDGDVEGGS